MFRRSRDAKTAWLAEHVRLYGLTRADVDTLAATGDRTTVPAGTTIIRAGRRGREAFLVVAGEVEVRRDGQLVATLGPGELVGELALAGGADLRTADVVTATEVELIVFDPRSFDRAVATSPLLRTHLDETVAARTAA